MQAFLEYVVKGLVDQPDAVEVTAVEKSGMTAYQLRVAPGDAGKIIGRRGTTIQALRSLVQLGAQKRGIRCVVDLIDD